LAKEIGNTFVEQMATGKRRRRKKTRSTAEREKQKKKDMQTNQQRTVQLRQKELQDVRPSALLMQRGEGREYTPWPFVLELVMGSVSNVMQDERGTHQLRSYDGSFLFCG
jgi:hypothetical protein